MRTTALALLVIAALLPPTLAHADDAAEAQKKEAQAFFEEGLRLAKGNDTKAAVAAFRQAYARYPSFRVLYNIGQLCSRGGDGACAVRAYERYLRDGGKEIPAKRRREVEAEIRQLSKTLGRVAVTTNVTGAEIFVDEESVGQTPLVDAVAVSGGAHKIVATADGSLRAEKSVDVVTGQTVAVDLTLEKAPEGSAEATDAEKEPEGGAAETPAKSAESSGPAPFPVVPWAITGGLALATAVTGLLALGAYSDYEETRDRFPISREDLDSAHGSARDLFLVTTAFGVATVVSAGVATYFTLGGKAPEPGKEKTSPSARRPRNFAVVPTLGGIVLTGGFP